MKKIVYVLLLSLTFLLGIQNIKAEGNLTCVYEYDSENVITVIINPGGTMSISYKYSGFRGNSYLGNSLPEITQSLDKCTGQSGYLDTVTNGADSVCNATNIVLTQFIDNEEFKCLPSFKYQKLESGSGQTKQIKYNYGFDSTLEEGTFYNFMLNESKSSNTIQNKVNKACNFYVQDGLGTSNKKQITITAYINGLSSAALANPIAWKGNGNLIVNLDGNVPSYNGSCSDYGTLYTNCHNVKNGSCNISSEKGNGYVELTIDENQKTYEDTAYSGTSDGGLYLNYLYQLKVPLSLSPNYSSIQERELSTNQGKVTINNLDERFGYNDAEEPYLCTTADCGGQEYIENAIERGTRNIANYCNGIYAKYAKDKSNYEARMQECNEFGQFYGEIVENGIIGDLSSDCPLLSNDMIAKLKWVLNIFRIVAPLLAFGLATIDFIKVIASGDADKEMKNAGKRLLYRIIAAILLLVIPTIIAFLLDVFLGSSDGYNSDNPFCSIVDKWSD